MLLQQLEQGEEPRAKEKLREEVPPEESHEQSVQHGERGAFHVSEPLILRRQDVEAGRR